MKNLSISVIGLGFVGLSLVVTNARKGFNTIAIDVNKKKLRSLSSGKPDFYEPLLKKYLLDSLRLKKIQFTDDLNKIIQTDITFITVGTPALKNGQIDLSQLKSVITSVSKTLKNKKKRHLIVIKSTVIPTTTSNIVYNKLKKMKTVGVVVNPEFLREGSAINDLLKPHMIVIGQNKKKDGDCLEEYYKKFYKKVPYILRTDFNTAEIIKYANNAFLATKISFINSIANICQKISGSDVNIIANAIGRDSRIGPQFLNAGPGFGGSCLPKDLSAFIQFTKKFGNANSLLKAVKNVNENQPNQIINLMKQMQSFGRNKTVSVLGLAFKKNTDDVRESVAVRLVNMFLRSGLKVKVHDPMALNNFRRIFREKISYHKNVIDCTADSECCVILTDWNKYKNLTRKDFQNMKIKNIIDTRRILNASRFAEFNFKAIGLGNETVRARKD